MVFLKVQEMQTSSVSFQGIVDMVVKELDEAGVMREKDGRPVKLHATGEGWGSVWGQQCARCWYRPLVRLEALNRAGGVVCN